MPQEFRPADPQADEYKAFARHFDHEGEEPDRRAVLYVVATMTYPDSGWDVAIVEQTGEPETWRLLEDEPGFRDGERTYYVAAGTSEHELEAVPRTIRVITATGSTRVSVVPWD